MYPYLASNTHYGPSRIERRLNAMRFKKNSPVYERLRELRAIYGHVNFSQDGQWFVLGECQLERIQR